MNSPNPYTLAAFHALLGPIPHHKLTAEEIQSVCVKSKEVGDAMAAIAPFGPEDDFPAAAPPAPPAAATPPTP